MAEKIVTIESAEWKEVQKGKNKGHKFMQITDVDGDKYSIFDSAFYHLLLEGETIVLRGEFKGDFFNPTEVLPASGAPFGPPSKKAETGKATARAPDLKNRAFALSYAKDLAVAGKIEVNDIGAYARKYTKYLDTGE